MPMTLKQRISDDMKAAMRAKQADRLLAIRNLMAAMKQREVDERIELDDAVAQSLDLGTDKREPFRFTLSFFGKGGFGRHGGGST